MNLQSVDKYVINLKRRPERLKEVTEEFEKLEWEFKRFEGIDRGSYLGCLQSHLELVKLAKEQELDNILVAEDDIKFLPWTKSLIKGIESTLSNLDFGILNLNMSIHRPVNFSKESRLLLDLTNLPPKEEHHRGIYSTGIIVYNKSVYNDILKIKDNGKTEFDLGDSPRAIDEHLNNHIYPRHKSFSTHIPFSTQKANWSDVSGMEMNNHYIQTYNWNVYTPVKLNTKWFDEHTAHNFSEDLEFNTVYE